MTKYKNQQMYKTARKYTGSDGDSYLAKYVGKSRHQDIKIRSTDKIKLCNSLSVNKFVGLNLNQSLPGTVDMA